MPRNGRSSKAQAYAVSDGKLLLTLTEDEGGWYCVTSPMDPELVTMARNIRHAFEMAYDALHALQEARKLPIDSRLPAQKRRRRTLAAK